MVTIVKILNVRMIVINVVSVLVKGNVSVANIGVLVGVENINYVNQKVFYHQVHVGMPLLSLIRSQHVHYQNVKMIVTIMALVLVKVVNVI
jgi:hypothetical protein